jgi:hypothetical protein
MRTDSTTAPTFPPAVTVRTIDYSSPSTIVDALKGQDAVISALNHGYLSHQRALLDASVSAGVQRFIPSEFGSDTLNAKAGALPVFAHKKKEQSYFEELAAEEKITYTIVFGGPFLDFGLDHGFLGVDLKNRKYTYLDGGVSKFSTSTMATVGNAVIGVLSKPEETKNRAVYVQDRAFSIKELYGLTKKAVGGENWTEVDGGETAVREKESYEKLAKGEKNMGVFVNFLMNAIFREGYGGHFQKLDNELLGIKELKDGEVVEIIKDIAAKRAAAA